MTPHSIVSESQLSHVIFLHGDIDNFGDIANIATFANAFFSFVYCGGWYPTSFYYAARWANR